MLDQLRIKFVAITTALVALILMVVIALSLTSARTSFDSIAQRSLERGLGSQIEAPSVIGATAAQNDGSELSGTHMIVVSVLIDRQGNVLRSNSGIASMRDDELRKVVNAVLAGDDEGYFPNNYLRWRSISYDDSTRIAIVDTEDIENAFQQQVLNTLGIASVTIILVGFASWYLARWALSPTAKSLQQQQQLIADLSHDLKTPLAVILSNVHILGKSPDVAQDARKWVESTEDEARNMQGLIEQMLEIARLDDAQARAKDIIRESIDMSELVEGVVLHFEPLAFERGVTIEEVIEEGIETTGDPELLERLVTTLIDNACKYAIKGSVVRVGLSGDGQSTLFAVSNEGDTIDPEDLPHIFDRFWRSDKARTRGSHGGFGLGLAIAKGIVDAHGGTIMASSEEGVTTFFVHL